MRKERQLVLHTALFGKVIAYRCAACDKTFSVSLLDEAVPWDFSPPVCIKDASLRHICEERTNWFVNAVRRLYAARYRCLEFLMALDDDDVPYSYLLYVVAIFAAIALIVVGAYFFLFR